MKPILYDTARLEQASAAMARRFGEVRPVPARPVWSEGPWFR